jgi:hypothetical protein
MATLDEISQEKQKLSERLARIDADRAKVAQQLEELEIAERVLSRFEPAPSTDRRRRGQPARPAAPERPARAARPENGPSLSEAALQAVARLGGGVTAAEVMSYLTRDLGMSVRPNHLGIALQRHRRAGRLESRDSRWYMPQQSARGETQSAMAGE